ncbi:MAG TPA: TonB-dependent receptor [Candidatus Marinimicrobia bacterium]|nr:TonB-dependent receptor [Candidatus Neomarinimicrobiota bacterium]
MKKILFILTVIIPQMLLAQGILRGNITDAKNGQPLPGANIILKGTYYGAASDIDGTFLIRNISAGSYDVEVSMIGYTRKLYSGIEVKSGQDQTFDIRMEPTVLALGQEVTVIGERPIVDTDATSSSVSMKASELQDKIVESVADIVGQQVGVSQKDNEIHIRGGRVDEAMFVVDGLSIKDPLTGTTSTLYVNSNAIEELELITGGFNAEYGQAMSGIIDVKLKEGAKELEGSFRYKTDKLQRNHFNSDNVEFTLGGPIFKAGGWFPGSLSYFTSAYLNVTDTYLPTANKIYPYRFWMEDFVFRAQNDLSLMAKLSWSINPKHKFAVSYNHSANVNQGFYSRFPYEYKEILDNYPTSSSETQVINTIWTHTLNSRAFYTINVGYFYTGSHRSVQNKHWSEYEEVLDLDPTEYTVINEFGEIRSMAGDKFWDVGDAPWWYDYYSKNLSLESNLTYQFGQRHTLKTGYMHRYTELQVVDIYKPWVSSSGFGESYDFYKVYPSNGSFYIQDKIVFEGMITNIGFRYDYWLIGDYVTRAVENPEVLTITETGRELYMEETFSFFGHRAKAHLSPRLGISHPVTDNDVLYFNYGHFSQLPTYNYVYAKLNNISENTYQLIGNPNLNPKTTVAYEIGLKHKFSASSALELKAYYKDMFDYETSQSITTFNPLLGRYSLMMYVNMDYARSRGLEFIYRKLYGRYFSGDISASYAIATGKASTPNDNLLVEAGMLSSKPITENYLSWDEPFRIVANFRINVNEDERPRLFGLPIPNNFKISAHMEFQSGRRFTASVATDTIETSEGRKYFLGFSQSDRPYSELADPVFTVDVKINKYFKLKRLRYSIFVDIENLFDFPVPRRINPFTGRPYDPGEIVSYSYANGIDPNSDPSRYRSPRHITSGLSFNF